MSEYDCAAYSKKMNVTLNVTNISGEVAARIEETKQEPNIRHLLYGGNFIGSRLKSRKNLLKTTINQSQTTKVTRIKLWKKKIKEHNS